MADLTPETLREWAKVHRVDAKDVAAHGASSEHIALRSVTADILDGIAALWEQQDTYPPNVKWFATEGDLRWFHKADLVDGVVFANPAAALIALGQQSKENGNG